MLEEVEKCGLRSALLKQGPIWIYKHFIGAPMASCKNHPNAEATATCARCSIPICGLCSSYIEAEAFCERCVDIQETEQLVASKTRQLDQKANPVPSNKTQIKSPKSGSNTRPASSPLSGRGFLAGIIVLVAGVLFYVNPSFMSTQDRARQAALDATEDCREVFEEIGLLLFNNQMPDPSLRCEEALAPNVIVRDGTTIRIEHPNPGYIGFREIYVTNTNRIPTFIE